MISYIFMNERLPNAYFNRVPEADEVLALRAELRTAENTATLVDLQAKNAQSSLNYSIGNSDKPTAEPFTPESFSALHDLSRPTVLIDYQSSYSGIELVGMAAQRYKIPVNLVYTSFASGSTLLTEREGDMNGSAVVSSGFIVDAFGQVHYGDFPTNISAQLIETSAISTMQQAEALGVPTSQSSVESLLLGDKDTLELLTQGTGLNAPRRISYDELSDPEVSSNVVIKPSKLGQGIGVFIADEHTTPEHAQKVYCYLQESGYAPIIESKIHCLPATDPETGDILDWNVRALIFNGQPIGAYVRADHAGKPVNRCNGAMAIPLDDFASYFADSATAERAMALLHNGIAIAASNYPSGYIGVDLTITPDFEDYIFEVNGSKSGGLQTIAHIASTAEGALESSTRLAEAYYKMSSALDARSPSQQGSLYYPVPDFGDLAFAAHGIDKDDLLAMIPIERLPLHDGSFGHGRRLALEAIRDISQQDGSFSDMTEAVKILQRENSLDAKRVSSLIWAPHKDLPELSETVALIASLYPNDTKWLNHQAAIAAARFDIAELRAIYKRIKSSEAKAEPIGIGMLMFIMLQNNPMLSRELSPANDPHLDLTAIALKAVAMCCEDDDSSVSEYLSRVRAEAPNKLEQSIARLDFILALGDRRYDDATLLLQSCDDDFYYSDFVFETVMQEMRPSITSNPEGLLFYADYAFSVGVYSDTFVLLNEALKELDDDNRDRVLIGLQAIEMGDFDEEESGRMVELLAAHSTNTTSEDSTGEGIRPDDGNCTSFDIYIYLLGILFTNRREHIDTRYFNAIRRDRRLADDASTLESIFIDLGLSEPGLHQQYNIDPEVIRRAIEELHTA